MQFPFSKPSLHNQKPTCSFILITVDMQVSRHRISGAINPTYFAEGGDGYRVARLRRNEGVGCLNLMLDRFHVNNTKSARKI